jgi:hypothetical protein
LGDLDFAITCTMLVQRGVDLGFGWISVLKPLPCGEPAVSLITCGVCKATGYCCESHRALVASSPRLFCFGCQTTAPGVDLFEFTPIGGE